MSHNSEQKACAACCSAESMLRAVRWVGNPQDCGRLPHWRSMTRDVGPDVLCTLRTARSGLAVVLRCTVQPVHKGCMGGVRLKRLLVVIRLIFLFQVRGRVGFGLGLCERTGALVSVKEYVGAHFMHTTKCNKHAQNCHSCSLTFCDVASHICTVHITPHISAYSHGTEPPFGGLRCREENSSYSLDVQWTFMCSHTVPELCISVLKAGQCPFTNIRSLKYYPPAFLMHQCSASAPLQSNVPFMGGRLSSRPCSPGHVGESLCTGMAAFKGERASNNSFSSFQTIQVYEAPHPLIVAGMILSEHHQPLAPLFFVGGSGLGLLFLWSRMQVNGGALVLRASFFYHSPLVPVFAPTSPNNLGYFLAVSKKLAHPLHPVYDDGKGGGWKWWE